MEELILTRWGLLGIVVLVAIRYVPRWLDRLTAWAIKHAETDDRTDEKMTDAIIDELRRGGMEREAARQERLQMVTAQQNLVMALHTHSGDLVALRDDLRDFGMQLRDFGTRLQDFDARLSLYFRTRGENNP